MGRSASSWELASPLIACSQPVTPAAKGFFCLALFAEWEVVEAVSVVSTQKKWSEQCWAAKNSTGSSTDEAA